MCTRHCLGTNHNICFQGKSWHFHGNNVDVIKNFRLTIKLCHISVKKLGGGIGIVKQLVGRGKNVHETSEIKIFNHKRTCRTCIDPYNDSTTF